MRKLMNTLYVTTPDAYLSLDGENIVILKDDSVLTRFPLQNLEGIITFGYTGASPRLWVRGLKLTTAAVTAVVRSRTPP